MRFHSEIEYLVIVTVMQTWLCAKGVCHRHNDTYGFIDVSYSQIKFMITTHEYTIHKFYDNLYNLYDTKIGNLVLNFHHED